MILFLVRHARHDEAGTVLSGRCPGEAPLNAEGYEQAARLAATLMEIPLRAIHSSPQRRALETASVIARARGQEVQTVEALDEIDFGRWTGATFASLRNDPLWNQWNSERGSCRPPAGEAMQHAVYRAAAHVETLAHQNDDPVLCVTHCDIIRGLVTRWLGMPLDNLLRLEADPASLSVAEVGPSGWRVMALNRIAA